MIDHEHNIRLYGISSRGFELAERYRDACELEQLPQKLRDTLAAIADEREALMERFGDRVKEEGGLPKAGNPEKEWLENLMDRWSNSVSGSEAVINRLLNADQEWLDEVSDIAASKDWPASLEAVLDELANHARDCGQRLRRLLPAPREEV